MSSDSTLATDLPPYISPFYLEPTPPKRMRLVDLTVQIPSTSRSQLSPEETRPPARWKTAEFRFYFALACVVIPIMIWIPISLSFCTWAFILNCSPSLSPFCPASHPNYPFFRSRLSDGWLFGRQIVSRTPRPIPTNRNHI